MKVYLGDISESGHADPGQIVAVAQTEIVGEMSLLQTTLVDHGLQVSESNLLVGPDQLRGVAGAGGAVHLQPGVALLVEVAGDLQLVPQDAHTEVDSVRHVLQVSGTGHVPQPGQLGANLHQLDQSPAGEPQVGVPDVVQDEVGDVLGTGAGVVGLK